MSTYGKQGRPPSDLAARFWAKVNRTEGCWLWTAATDKSGRTKFSWNGKVEPANRIAWLLTRGAPPSHPLRNLCGNPSCVHPEHWGKPKYNKRPMTASQRDERARSRFMVRIRYEVHVPALGPCWMWQGYTDPNGYGRATYQGKRDYTHRIAFFMAGKEIPEGKELDHLCRVRGCCNPKHLEPVTHQVNCARSPIHVFFHPELRSTFNQPATHCKQGHALTPDNRHKGGRGRCAICARRNAAETAARIKDDPKRQERVRERRRARHEINGADPAFRERQRERGRQYYQRKKADPAFMERERQRCRERYARGAANMTETGEE